MTASFDNFSAFVEDDTSDPENAIVKKHFQFHGIFVEVAKIDLTNKKM